MLNFILCKLRNSISGCSAAGSAGGLGVPYLYPRRGKPKRRKALQRLHLRNLGSWLKQAENQQWPHDWPQSQQNFNFIAGCSAVGSAGGLGPSGRGFEPLHSDQKLSEISDFRELFLFLVYCAAGFAYLPMHSFKHKNAYVITTAIQNSLDVS